MTRTEAERRAAKVEEVYVELLQGLRGDDVRKLRDEAVVVLDMAQVRLCERLMDWQESDSTTPDAADEAAARACAEILCAGPDESDDVPYGR